MKSTRRQFMILSAAGACTLALNGKVQAQAMVSETDPQAAALGYKADANKVDKAKYAKYAAVVRSAITALLSRQSWLFSRRLFFICWQASGGQRLALRLR
jgi:hypothetical protein